MFHFARHPNSLTPRRDMRKHLRPALAYLFENIAESPPTEDMDKVLRNDNARRRSTKGPTSAKIVPLDDGMAIVNAPVPSALKSEKKKRRRRKLAFSESVTKSRSTELTKV